MTSSIAPVTSKDKAGHEAHSVNDITDHSLQPPNMLVKYTDFDVAEDKCMFEIGSLINAAFVFSRHGYFS